MAISFPLPLVGVRALAVTAALALIPAFSPADPAFAAAGCRTTVPGDVNGDGLAEVAVGESGNHVGAGAVHVFYGHKSGLVTKKTGSARNDQYFTQNSPGVPGSDDGFDAFGSAVALGDFNDAIAMPIWPSARPGRTTTPARSPSCTARRPASPRPALRSSTQAISATTGSAANWSSLTSMTTESTISPLPPPIRSSCSTATPTTASMTGRAPDSADQRQPGDPRRRRPDRGWPCGR